MGAPPFTAVPVAAASLAAAPAAASPIVAAHVSAAPVAAATLVVLRRSFMIKNLMAILINFDCSILFESDISFFSLNR